ncbi:MAG: penicillin acylase family protein, partial [Pseudomonadota bacterium]|nr:penicillin acylase family protein [Pseudomonadota bacterium]
LWDQFGIPHIYGSDRLTVVRGLGYAEMENHAETILMNVASARGRSAEYFGPGGTDNPNVKNDITVRTEGIPNRAQHWLETGGDEQADIIQAFTEGVNEYAKRHGDTIDPSFRRVLPFVPTDVTAGIQYTVHFHFMPGQDNLPALISAWQNGGISAANAVACSFTPGCSNGTSVARNDTLGGSNGWAIAPNKSASGNAILMGNPHQPWGNNSPVPGLGIFQFMEANLVIGDPEKPRLNASGVVLMGAPFLGIGYSDEIGWTHTNNTIQNTNLYELTLNANGTYAFGGGVRPLQHRTGIIKVRQADGSLASQTIDIFASVHGPVIAQNPLTHKALALRVAGLQQPALVTQYWRMIKAHNLDEFIAANSRLQMPFFNVIYADRDGHILYVFGGQQPVRQGGDWGKYAGILDGSDPSLLWSDTFGWFDLPRAIDPPGGFVANSNNPPWTSTFPKTPTNDPAEFPAYFSPQFMDLRPQNGAIFLQSKGSLTIAQILSGKESTHMLLADRVLPDLINAAILSGNPIAQAAAATLATWKAKVGLPCCNGNADATSKGAVLFEAWWAIVTSQTPATLCPSLPTLAKDNTINFYSPHPQFRVGWSASDPLNTPVGLANAAATVPHLICAAKLVQVAYGALDVAWGDVHKIVLATHDPTFQTTIPISNDPQSGADDPFGPLRVLFRFPEPDGIHYFAVSGDGYVQLIEFAKDGAKAQALLGYGNASRPGSTHVTDQLPFFEAKTLRPTFRTRDEVEKHTVSREVVF